MTITYHLRRDLRGPTALRSRRKDVKWSWEAIMNPNSNVVSRHGYDVVAA